MKQYQKSIIAYIDFLGIRELIYSEENQNNDILTMYLDIIQEHKPIIYNADEEIKYVSLNKQKQIKIFSDNLVIHWPYQDVGEIEFGYLIDDLISYQFEFAKKGILMRGGITVNLNYMDSEIVIGPGLIEAYELEDKMAINPRIIIGKKASDLLLLHHSYYGFGKHSPQFSRILKDADGLPFLNYLLASLVFSDDNKIIEELGIHKEMILLNLQAQKKKSKIWSKYRWLGDYHNYFIKKFLGMDKNTRKLLIRSNYLNTNFDRIEAIEYDDDDDNF